MQESRWEVEPPRSIVIVGASLAGLRAAETARAAGFDGRLTLIGAETHLPYDRPPLSKQLLAGQWEPDRINLRKPDSYPELDLELLLGRKATALDLHEHIVELDHGKRVRFDGLVIATGARPRMLPFGQSLAGVHTLRTLDDSLAIRATLDANPRVVVVGAGFIGAEVAATCRSRGLDVVMVEPFPTPLYRALGPEVGGACTALHAAHGVELRLSTSVVGLRGSSRVEAVELTDGSVVPADIVVVGIGVEPETEWLRSSGLALDDGVLCDATCATAAPGVVAAGDVARWQNPIFGRAMRVEHWTNAAEQGAAAARRLLQGEVGEPYTSVPWVWSDQYDARIQVFGDTLPSDDVTIVQGSLTEGRFVALYGRSEKLVGVATFNQVRAGRKYEKLIATGAAYADALAVE